MRRFFWGDSRDEQARGSLRHAIAALRSALGTNAIAGDHESVALSRHLIETDIEMLEAACKASLVFQPAPEEIYNGDFLEGYSLPNQEFEDWLTFERTRCRNLAETGFERIIAGLIEEGRAIDAVPMARRLVVLDPLREHSHRLLMSTLTCAGERGKALAQFNEFKSILARELNVEPSAQTMELAASLTESGGPRRSQDASSARQCLEAGPRQTTSAVTHPGSITIAVLPFANLSEKADDRYWRGGFQRT